MAAGLIAAMPGRKGLAAAAILMGALALFDRTFLVLSTVWFAGALVALTATYDRHLGSIAFFAGAGALALAAWQGAIYLWSGIGATEPAQMAGDLIRGYDLAIGIFFATCLYFVVHGKMRVPAFAHGAAKYTYTLYIIHFPILLFVYGVAQPRIEGSLGASAVTAVAAAFGCWLLARALAPWLESRKLVAANVALPTAPA